jgi:hypothetical protein
MKTSQRGRRDQSDHSSTARPPRGLPQQIIPVVDGSTPAESIAIKFVEPIFFPVAAPGFAPARRIITL